MINEKTNIEDYSSNKINKCIFNYMIYLLKESILPIEIEIYLIVIEMIQMLSFIFNPFIHSEMLQKTLYESIFNVLDSFCIVSIFKEHQTVYLLFYYCCVAYVFVFSLMSIALCIYLKNTSFNQKYLLFFMHIWTKVTTGILFVPLLNTFLSIINCTRDDEYLFFINVSLSSLMSILLIGISYIFIVLGYDIRYNDKVFNSKLSSDIEVLLLIEKIGFVLVKEMLNSKDTMMLCYFLMSVLVASQYFFYNSYYNTSARQMYSTFHYLLLWNSLIVVVERLISFTYIPTISMIAGCPIVIIVLLFINYHNSSQFFISKRRNSINSLLLIIQFINTIETYESNREKEIILDSFIYLEEIQCLKPNCYIKKYLNNPENKQRKVYLLFHAEELFQKLIEKYPLYCLPKIFYFDFLIKKLNNRYKALRVLSRIDKDDLSFYNAFFIYKIVNEINPTSYNENIDDDISLDLIYKIHFREFKLNIMKALAYYNSFWNLLLTAHKHSNNDVIKLKNIGSDIYNTIKSIDVCFEKLQQITQEDKVVLKFYIDFQKYILYDTSKAEKYRMKLNEVEEDVNLTNYSDINTLFQADKYEYIILSNDNNTFGIIQRASICVCKYLEYTLDELIGQPLDIILPGLLREEHSKLLHDKYDDFFNRYLPFNNTKKTIHKTFQSFALTKSKYIVPLTVSPFIMANESQRYYFGSRIVINNNSMINEDQCYVITNMDYTITNFTRNASVILDISSKDFNQTNIGTFISKNKLSIDIVDKGITQATERTVNNINSNNYITSNYSIIKINGISLGYILKIRSKNTKTNKDDTRMTHYNQNSFDKDYLPFNKEQFSFNLNDYSYFLYQNNSDSANKLNNYNFSLFTKLMTAKNSSCSESEEDSSNDYYQSSSNNDNSRSNSLSLEGSIKDIHEPSTHLNNNEDYYHVNTDIITLSCYDYDKRQFDAIPKGEKPIERILNQTINIGTNLTVPKKDSKPKIMKSLKIQQYYQSEQTKDRFITQLKFALNKKENQKEITLLSIISLGTAILCIVEGIILYLFYYNAVNNINRANLLVISSFDMLINSVVTVFLVRELTLITNDKYISFSSDKLAYRNEIIDELRQYTENTTIIFDQIIGNSFYITQANSIGLYNSTMKIYFIRDDLSSLAFNMSLYDSVSESLDALSSIALNPGDVIIPSSPDEYFHVINGLNGINVYMNMQATIFIEELNNEIYAIYTESLSLIIILLFINICTYALMFVVYLKVEQKKENYLNIFFEIGSSSIQKSISLCDQFSNIHHNGSMIAFADDVNDTVDDDDDNETDDIGKESIQLNQKDQKQNELKSLINKHCKHSSESISIKMFYIGYLSIIIIIFSILTAIANNALMKISYSIQLIHGEIVFYSKCLIEFNLLREYMFDKNINVFYSPLETYMTDSFGMIYLLLLEKNNKHQKLIKYAPPEYKKVDSELKAADICDFFQRSPSLPQSFTCQNGSYGANKLGLNVFVTFFIEEIRSVKNSYEVANIIAKKYGFKYNETLLGLDEYDQLPPNDSDETINQLYEKYHPINFFNSYSHNITAISFRYILVPIITYLKNGMLIGLANDASNFTLTYMTFSITYIIVIIAVYLIIWKHIESKLRDMIYSTKSMLGIIPIELLINLSSIERIYGLKDELV